MSSTEPEPEPLPPYGTAPAYGTRPEYRPPPPTPPPVEPRAAGLGPRGGVHAVRIVGVLVTAALLVAGTGSMLFAFFSQSETVTTEVTDRVTKLATDGTTGDVRVRVGRAGDAVTVKETLHWTFSKPRPAVPTVADGVLTISPRCDGWAPCAADLDVTVPPGTELRLETTTGDIRAQAQGSVVDARSTTGDVTVDGAGSASVEARATTGDVTVNGDTAAARIGARTTTGDVTVNLTAVPADLTATTSTGDVVVTVPPGHPYRVDAFTHTGDVSVDPSLAQDTAAEHLTLRTNTGDVTVRTPPRRE